MEITARTKSTTKTLLHKTEIFDTTDDSSEFGRTVAISKSHGGIVAIGDPVGYYKV